MLYARFRSVWLAIACHQLWLNPNEGVFYDLAKGFRQILAQVSAMENWADIELAYSHNSEEQCF